MNKSDVFLLDDTLAMLTAPTSMPIYDFDFRAFFPCKTRWIVIECNDAQESGYAGASAIGIWQNILTIERELKQNRS